MQVPNTVERVPLHTKQEINDRIVDKTLTNVALYEHASPELRNARARELDREWDTERAIATFDGALLLVTGLMGLLAGRRRWLYVVPAFIGANLLMHAFQGWCVLVPVLRRYGVRTPHEIAAEKAAILR